jgi:hypothetical protein
MSQITSRKPRELRQFEEVRGEFRGFEVSEDKVLALLRDSWAILLPKSASKGLLALKPGDRIAILMTDNDENPVRVRRLRCG